MKYMTIIFVFLISGCEYMPPKETGEFNSDSEMSKMALLLAGLAKKCWSKKPEMLADGIRIDARMSVNETVIITAHRWAYDIGYREPFFIAKIINDENRSTVTTKEGDYACGFSGCYQLNFTNDLKRWVDGDHSCRKEPLKTG